MAGNDSGFKHIAVTAAEEDEVILAGEACSEPSAPHDGCLPAEGVSAAERVSPRSFPEAPEPSDSDSGSAENASSHAGPSSGRRVSPAADRTRPPSENVSRRKGEYHETTLEDLEPTPLPIAQKIVIIAAVVCIIGALVYYFVAMR